MGIIENKPQFNTSLLKPGTAIRVKITRRHNVPEGWYEFDCNCLIVSSTPLYLMIGYVKEERGGNTADVYTKQLPIEIVADGTITITEMVDKKREEVSIL